MGRAGLPRRRVLAVLALAPLAGCGLLGTAADDGPDPLIVLADAARGDAALADAVVAAEPGLAERVAPLADARREHAAALDAEVLRADPDHVVVPAPRNALGVTDAAGLAEAVRASAAAAVDVALGLPAGRVGLVASVAACCSAYAALLAEEPDG